MVKFSIGFTKLYAAKKSWEWVGYPYWEKMIVFCNNILRASKIFSAHEKFGPNFVFCLLLFRSETVQELLGYIADPKRCLNRDLSNLAEFEMPSVVEIFSGGRPVFPGDDNTQNLHRMSKFCYYFSYLISQSLVVLW